MWAALAGLWLTYQRRADMGAAIGTLPGTVAFVLVGASVTRLDEGIGGIDQSTFVVSVVLIAASVLGSKVIRRRQRRQ